MREIDRWMWVHAEVFQQVIVIDWMWEMRGKKQARMMLRFEAQVYIMGFLVETGLTRTGRPHRESGVRVRVVIWVH